MWRLKTDYSESIYKSSISLQSMFILSVWRTVADLCLCVFFPSVRAQLLYISIGSLHRGDTGGTELRGKGQLRGG